MTDELLKKIANECIIIGNFESNSGVKGNMHFDKYILQSNPSVLNEIADLILDLIPNGTEVILGLEMGSIPISTLISNKTNLPLSILRKKPKEDLRKRLLEGSEITDKNIVIIEDVIDSGKTMKNTLNNVKKYHPKKVLVISILYRGENINNLAIKLDVEIISLFYFFYLMQFRE